jgi:hypothetical protein
MSFDVTYYDPKDVVSKEEWEEGGRETWDAFAEYLEKDYEASTKR